MGRKKGCSLPMLTFIFCSPFQISDLLFIVAATVIVGNIVSVLVFKKRIY